MKLRPLFCINKYSSINFVSSARNNFINFQISRTHSIEDLLYNRNIRSERYRKDCKSFDPAYTNKCSRMKDEGRRELNFREFLDDRNFNCRLVPVERIDPFSHITSINKSRD